MRADRLVVGKEAAGLQKVAVRVQLLGHDMVVHAVSAVRVEHLRSQSYSLRRALLCFWTWLHAAGWPHKALLRGFGGACAHAVG